MLIVNTTHAHRVPTEYERHDNHHRPHQARNQQLPDTFSQSPRNPHSSRS
jgi:hypothetical protein